MTKANINVTPLIDVLLVLLIIFMVISPIKPSSFKVKLPAEPQHTSTVEPHPYTLIVSVSHDASLELNREAAGRIEEASGLVERLKGIFSELESRRALDENGNVARTVFIKAPKGISYGNVAKVIDAVKLAGAHPISLQLDALER